MASPNSNEFLASNRQLKATSGSIVPHVLLLLAQPILLACPNLPGRTVLSCITIISLAIWAQVNSPFTSSLDSMQPWTLMWPHWLATLSHIMSTADSGGPTAALWQNDCPSRSGTREWGIFSRLKRGVALMINLRGIRWNFQVKNIPKQHPERPSKTGFLVAQALGFLRIVLMCDLLLQLASHLFMTASDGQLGEVNSKLLTLRHVSDWRWSVLKTLVFGCGPYFFINLQYTVCSFISVAVGLTIPQDWPPFFGSLSEATSVRNFWGKFWHQSLRRSLSWFTGALVDGLGIHRGTNLSSYTQIWAAFTISGIMHSTSMLMLPSPTNITLNERTVGMVQFFLWQAAAITIEDLAHWIWPRAFGKRKTVFGAYIGYLWVIFSMWCSLPLAADVMLRLRLLEKSFLPFTIFGPWIKEHIPIP